MIGAGRKCLVIQLGSLSSQLQTLMAMRAVKQLYPMLEFTLVVPESVSQAADRTPWLAEVVRAPLESWATGILGGKRSNPEVMAEIRRWVQPIQNVASPWEWVVNATYNESSSFLMALIPGKHKLGYGRGRDGSIHCNDDWSMYVEGVLHQSIPQDIHMTDVITTQLLTSLQIHAGEPHEEAQSQTVTSRSFFTLSPVDSSFDLDWQHSSLKWMAIHLDSARWGTDKWLAFAQSILDKNPDYNLVLCGKKIDLTWAAELEKQLRLRMPRGNKLVNRVGVLDFDQWAQILSRCQWVVAFPGAAIQLASVLGTRALMLAPREQGFQASFMLEGPYGNGHYVVVPKVADTNPHGDLEPEAVVSAWMYASTEWSHQRRRPLQTQFEQLNLQSFVEGCSVYRSRIRTVQEGGGVYFEPLFPRPLTVNEWTARVLGQVARLWYCGWTSTAGQELESTHLSADLLRELRALVECIDVIEKISNQAVLACTQISEKSERLHSEKVMRLQDREVISNHAAQLRELDQLMDRMVEIREPLKFFTNMRMVMMHELQGKGLTELGKSSALAYQKLGEAARLFRDWIKASLERAKPRMVHVRKVKPAEDVTA